MDSPIEQLREMAHRAKLDYENESNNKNARLFFGSMSVICAACANLFEEQDRRIKELESGAKAHERQLRNLMPDRSNDI